MKNFLYFLVLLFTFSLILFGCTTLEGDDDDDNDDNDDSTVSTSITMSGFAAKIENSRAGKSGSRASGLDTDRAQLSITPTKMQMKINSISLYENYDLTNETNTGKSINIEVNTTKDLAALDEVTPIFSIEQSVTSEEYGTYRYINVSFDGDNTVVSGSQTIDGKTYSFTDVDASIGWNGMTVNLPEYAYITIAEGSSPSAGIIIDIEDCICIRRIDDYASIPADDKPPLIDATTFACLIYNNPTILPHVSSSTPNIDHFIVDITNDLSLDSNGDYLLKFVCVYNDSNAVMSASWTGKYGKTDVGVSTGMAFEPAALLIQSLVSNGDGSYKIDDINYTDVAVRDRALHFPAFKFETHTGFFYYGDPDTTPGILYYNAQIVQ